MSIPTRRRLPTSQRRKIIENQDSKCYYCKHPFDIVVTIKNFPIILEPHFDHIEPFSLAYNDTLDNLVAACNVCNNWKADKVFDTLEEIQDLLIPKWIKVYDAMLKLPTRIHSMPDRPEILLKYMQEQTLDKTESNQQERINNDAKCAQQERYASVSETRNKLKQEYKLEQEVKYNKKDPDVKIIVSNILVDTIPGSSEHDRRRRAMGFGPVTRHDRDSLEQYDEALGDVLRRYYALKSE